MIDGISGAEIMGLLLDLGPDGPLPPADSPWRGPAEEMPGTREMLARAALGIPRYPLRMLRALPRAIPNVEDTPFATLPGAADRHLRQPDPADERTAVHQRGRPRGAPGPDLVISNVPGPQIPLYRAGARLVANYPVSVIADGMGLNITVMSYLGSLDFGIVADRDQMPDVHRLIDWLREGVTELLPQPASPPARAEAKAAKAPEKTRNA